MVHWQQTHFPKFQYFYDSHSGRRCAEVYRYLTKLRDVPGVWYSFGIGEMSGDFVVNVAIGGLGPLGDSRSESASEKQTDAVAVGRRTAELAHSQSFSCQRPDRNVAAAVNGPEWCHITVPLPIYPDQRPEA